MPSGVPVTCALGLVLLLLAGSCGGQTVIQGGGSTFAQPVFAQYLFAYNLIRPELVGTYDPIGSGKGLSELRSGLLDFGGNDSPAKPADIINYPYIRQYGHIAGVVALLVNLQGIKYSTSATQMVNISRSVAAGIFAGSITSWSDPAITALNPSLPAQTGAADNITVLVRSDSSGTTGILTSALTSFDPVAFPFGFFQSWNTTFLKAHPNFLSAVGSTGVSGYVQTIPGAIGYASLPYSISDLVPVAALENAQGQYISPYSGTQSSAALATSLQFDPVTNAANVIDLNATNVYPLLSLTYLILNIDTNENTTVLTQADCDAQREMLKMFHWALTTPSSQQAAINLGYVVLPQSAIDRLIGNLSSITCLGEQLLRIVVLDQHTGVAFPIVLAFSMLLFFLSLAAISIAWYSGTRAKNPLFYALCLFLGCSASYVSVIFFYLAPTHTYICQLRQWLLAMGLTLLLGVMFVRGWLLHTLHQQERQHVSAPRVVSVKMLAAILGVICFVQVVILVCWSAIDTLSSNVEITNGVDLQAVYVCSCDRPLLWLLLELFFFLILLGWGLYVVYRTWSHRAAVDTRWTLIAIYNTLISLLIVIPLLATAADTDDWIFFLAAVGIDFAVASAVFSIYGSAILQHIIGSASKTSQSDDSSRGRSSSHPSSLRTMPSMQTSLQTSVSVV